MNQYVSRFVCLCRLPVLALILFAGNPVPGYPKDIDQTHYDVIIRNGDVYDGTGSPAQQFDVGIRGNRIAAIGPLDGSTAEEVIDAEGLAVSPGFINMLSWATESLIQDGRGMSDIYQGVTLEVFGEGWSMGPLTETMKQDLQERRTGIHYEIAWTTLGEYLQYLETRGISPNVASYVGADTLRIKHLGYENRKPSPSEMAAMQADVAQAMQEGAMGVGSALAYVPAIFADTEELIALTQIAGNYGGCYTSHIRSETDRLLQSVDEVLQIAKAAGACANIYHLKAAGKRNWPLIDQVIEKITVARNSGVDIRADMYTYTAGMTGLNATMPPWVQEGGHDAWVARLNDPETRQRLTREMNAPPDDWENLYFEAGAEGMLFASFRNPDLRPLIGKTLAEVAEVRGMTPVDTIIDLVIEDDSRIETAYFLMSEENIEKQIAQPWVTFQSDAQAVAPEGVFLENAVHPRAYGTFARLFAKYVREHKIIPVQEAVRRLTSLSAHNLGIKDRGLLEPGYFADVVVFDPMTIQDHATYANPHQLATGVSYVLVNGVLVLRAGEHTGALPGQFVRGPGASGTGEVK